MAIHVPFMGVGVSMGKCRNAKGMYVAWSQVLNTSVGIYCKFSFRYRILISNTGNGSYKLV